MSANVDLFVRVLAQIEKHPETWVQHKWAHPTDCGTAYCFAGWACALNGYNKVTSFSTTRTLVENAAVHTPEGVRPIPEVAARLLGIDMSSDYDPEVGLGFADWFGLFDGDNDLDDIYAIAATYLNLDETVLRDKVAAEVADGQVQP